MRPLSVVSSLTGKIEILSPAGKKEDNYSPMGSRIGTQSVISKFPVQDGKLGETIKVISPTPVQA